MGPHHEAVARLTKPLSALDKKTHAAGKPKVLKIRPGQGIGSAIVFIVRASRYMKLMSVDDVLYIDLSSAANIIKTFFGGLHRTS
jgi:hypothetical protein